MILSSPDGSDLITDDGLQVSIKGLALDSNKVRRGYLFAALPGQNIHGAWFVSQAISRGALAVLTDPMGATIALENSPIRKEQLILANNPRRKLARIASQFYGRLPEIIVAVTGTNGKTSVSTMCRQIWEELGHDAVSIGTTGIEGGYSASLRHTTPDPISLHDHLAKINDAAISHVVVEASSHGLKQNRLDGLDFTAAGFTNLTREHLDYHPSMNEYFQAKQLLFTERLKPDGVAVVCHDSAWGQRIAQLCRQRGIQTITIGQKQGTIEPLGQRLLKNGQEVTFRWQETIFERHLPLIGSFQFINALTASGLAIGSGCSPDKVFSVIEKLKPVRGRMELVVQMESGGMIFVDYAHTPDALKTALTALRGHCLGPIRVLFGAGGDRDKGKRAQMGAIARECADRVYVTDDNPRTEDPGAIRSAILRGCPDAVEIGDRSLAIFQAVQDLQGGEALLIAGKGHETEQIVGETALPFDDAEQASIAARIVEGKHPG